VAFIALPARAAQDDLSFRILRDGRDIGRHLVAFSHDGAATTVKITTDIRVGFGPITFYRFAQRATEQWNAGTLTTLVSETDDDGTKDYLRAVRTNAGLTIDGSAGPAFVAPSHARPASHWSRLELDGPMFSVQNGAMLDFAPKLLGHDTIQSRGQSIPASRHALGGKIKLELWYDAAGLWAGLRLMASDGSLITYERI